MSKRKDQAAASKELLMETARALISEKGYDKVTIQDIVQASGMSVGAFYHHFKNKNELVTAMDREPYRRNYEEVRGISSLGVVEQINLYMEKWLDLSASYYDINLSRQWFFYHISNPTPLSDPKNKMNIAMEELRECLKGAVESGEMASNTPVDDLARDVVLTLFGTELYYLITGGEFDAQQWRKNFCADRLRTILAPYFSGAPACENGAE